MNSPNNTILINLKVLQLLPVNHKIYIRNDRLYTHDTALWGTTLQRFSNGDNRIGSIDFLHKLLDEVKTKCNNKDDDERLLESLKGVVPGLQNLRNTYYSDVNTKSEIETIIDNITDFIRTTETTSKIKLI